MRRRLAPRWMLPLLACSVALSASLARAAESVSADRRFPSDAVGFFSIPDFKQLKSQFHSTSLGQLMKEKSLADFWQQVQKSIDEASEGVQKQLGISLEELISIPQGELAIGLVQQKNAPISYVLLMDFGDNGKTVNKLLDRASKQVEDDGAKRSEEDYQGVSMVIFTKKPEVDEQDKNAPPPPPQTMVWGIKDSFLLISSSVNAMKQTLDQWDGKGNDTLADNEVYHYIVERCRDENQKRPSTAVWFLDPVGFLKAMANSAPQLPPQAAEMMKALPTLGLNKFKGLGGTVDLADGDYDSISRTLVYYDTPATGVLQLLQFPPKALHPAKWVSAETSSYTEVNWDIEDAFKAITKVFDQFNGQGALEKIIDDIADAEEGPKINLKRDVVDQLNGDVVMLTEADVQDPLQAERYLFALGVKDADAMQKTLGAIARTPGFPGKPRDFKGATIYEIAPTPQEAEEDQKAKTTPVSAGIALVANHIMVATDVRLIENALRNGGDEPLADTASYKHISKFFPDRASSIGFQRSDVQARAMYDALRSGKASEVFGENVKIDFSTLPPFDAIKPFLRPSGSYMNPDKRGLFMVSFSLKNKAE
ncbi:MAG TPA: hypothetical protein VHB77_15845 [Planctomycetaceae bacterium]|nr:hypothetical protein [Planctomycetaceae bacterium]